MAVSLISLEGEIWKPLPEWEGFYEVSNLGRVKRLKRQKFKQEREITKTLEQGYHRVSLCRDSMSKLYFVHRLVMRAFIGYSDLPVNHIDGNSTNNLLSNLEYVTHRENTLHSKRGKYKRGVFKYKRRWKARFCCNGTVFNLGSFKTEDEAHAAYLEKAGYCKYL